MYIQDLSLSTLVLAEPGSSYQSKTNLYPWIEVLVDLSKLLTFKTNKIQEENVAIDETVEETLEKNLLNDVIPEQELSVDELSNKDLLIYKIPEHLDIKPGDILTVPIGAQQVGGIAIRLLSQPPANLGLEKIREVQDVVSKEFFSS
ncbi:MAG: primosomal protein N', partial [Sphaerospermopsis kisseleviana]